MSHWYARFTFVKENQMDIKVYRGVSYAEVEPDLFEVLCPCGCENLITMNYGKNDVYGEVKVIDTLDQIDEIWEGEFCLARIFHSANGSHDGNTSYLFGD